MGRTRWRSVAMRLKTGRWPPMPKSFLVATFSNAEELLRAVRAARERDFRIYDVYAPYPIHGLNQAMGIRRAGLPWVTLIAGAGALLFSVAFQFYTTVLHCRMTVECHPHSSARASLPLSSSPPSPLATYSPP